MSNKLICPFKVRREDREEKTKALVPFLWIKQAPVKKELNFSKNLQKLGTQTTQQLQLESETPSWLFGAGSKWIGSTTLDTTSENHLLTHVLVSCNLCFLSHVPILMSHIPCLISTVSEFLSKFFVSFLTSSVSYPTSPVLRLLPVSRLLSVFFLLYISCLLSCLTSYVFLTSLVSLMSPVCLSSGLSSSPLSPQGGVEVTRQEEG